MIKTRDFLLYAVVLIFLCVGVGVTILGDLWERAATSEATTVLFGDKSVSSSEAWVPDTTEDRLSILSRYKDKIAAGEGLEHGEPVLTSVDDVVPNDQPAMSDRAIQTCAGYNQYPAVIQSWPKVGVTMVFVEGVRRVSVAEVSESTESTSTSTSVTSRILADLPAVGVLQGSPACISSSVVGVASDGSLIKNNDTSRFAGMSEFALVGYALDGFPIYGFKGDVSNLDACGGVSEVTGYRYYLRPNEEFVLGCFSGAPVTLR